MVVIYFILFLAPQDVVQELVRGVQGGALPSLPLPGSTLLLLDLISAANTVLSLPPDTRHVREGGVTLFMSRLNIETVERLLN